MHLGLFAFGGVITTGTLHIVATPIGNLGDFPPRAVEILNSVELILAEDTRSFATLASRFGIVKPVQSCHEHNEKGRIEPAIELLKEGKSIALVSDAGTPLISDPGYRLVERCKAEGITVSGVPGPCAAVFALSISGFEADCFVFHGFLPQKKGKRKKLLQRALSEHYTAIFYESPHRILSTLEILAELDPKRLVFIGRELTKHFEECLTASSTELHKLLSSRAAIKGEFVMIIKRGEHSVQEDEETLLETDSET